MDLRLLEDDAAEAAWNMAVDEALLLGTGATLRLYGWRPHAVSLGYFQRHADFADVPATTPIVRRLTGGGAIHHGDEITFSLTVDVTALPRDVAASYRLLHDAAIAAMAELGVNGTRHPSGQPAGARPTDRWCFASPCRDDVVTSLGKLLGSAQRRIASPRPRVLHHGSLVLRRPALTPFVAAVHDQAPCDAAFAERLRDALAAHVATALGLRLVAGALTAAERSLAAELAERRYRDRVFLERC